MGVMALDNCQNYELKFLRDNVEPLVILHLHIKTHIFSRKNIHST